MVSAWLCTSDVPSDNCWLFDADKDFNQHSCIYDSNDMKGTSDYIYDKKTEEGDFWRLSFDTGVAPAAGPSYVQYPISMSPSDLLFSSHCNGNKREIISLLDN